MANSSGQALPVQLPKFGGLGREKQTGNRLDVENSWKIAPLPPPPLHHGLCPGVNPEEEEINP